MFKRLLMRYVLMNEAGAEGGAAGGGGAAAASPAAAPAAAAPADAGAAAPAAATQVGAVDGMPKSALGGSEPAAGEQPAGEAKKPDDASAGTEKKPGEEGAETKLEPIKYEDFTLPEGVKLDPEKFAKFTELAGGARISQEVAQQLVDLYTSDVTEAVNNARQQAVDSQVQAWNTLNKQWEEQAKADPVIGGQDYDKKLGQIKTALSTVLGKDAPEFFAAMDVYGSGTNHPAILRGLYKALQVHMPAAPVSGNGPSSNAKSAGATLYPTQAGLGNGHQG